MPDMTARDYLEQFEPGFLDLTQDPDLYLSELTDAAHDVATRHHIPISKQNCYPSIVWELAGLL